MRSSPTWGTRCRVAASGLAVPMSSPRYTCRASAEMTVRGQCAARASASAVFPTPVGPTMTGTSGLRAAKPALQLIPRELHDGGPAVDVVRGKLAGEEAREELPHLVGPQGLARLDGRPAGIRRGESLSR